MTDPCQYGKEISDINIKVTQIYEHLVGTLDKPGLIGRVVELERWKKGFVRLLGWATGTVMTAVIGAIALKLLKVY